MRAWLSVVVLALMTACSSLPDSARKQRADAGLAHLPALAGGYFPLDSKEAGRTYHIHIRLPEGYDPNAPRRYPVVYLLDGDSLFPLLAPTHLFLTYDEKLPEAILVGIAYGGFDPAVNKRNVDFPGTDSPPDESGARRFLAFLERELLPRVEAQYNADATKRVLFGSSRGGTFVVWSALMKPDLFWARIASNPGQTPRAGHAFDAPARPSPTAQIVITAGTRDTETRQRQGREWTRLLSEQVALPGTVKFIPIVGGTHAATIGEAYRRGMLWVFRTELPAGSSPLD